MLSDNLYFTGELVLHLLTPDKTREDETVSIDMCRKGSAAEWDEGKGKHIYVRIKEC
jgi:hypothetical protein